MAGSFASRLERLEELMRPADDPIVVVINDLCGANRPGAYAYPQGMRDLEGNTWRRGDDETAEQFRERAIACARRMSKRQEAALVLCAIAD